MPRPNGGYVGGYAAPNAVAAAGVWTPRDTATAVRSSSWPGTLLPANNLALWLDGDDISTITLNGLYVSEWRDKSGNGRHATQATAASQPQYQFPTLLNNRRNLATFQASNMTVPAWDYSSTNTAVFVFRAANLNQSIYQRGAVNNGPRGQVQNPASAGLRLRATIHGTVATQVHAEGPTYTANAWVIGATVVRASSLSVYQNGVWGTDASYTTSLSGSFGLTLFALNSSNLQSLGGNIAEFIYYDRALSNAEVATVAAYLSSKWGIAIS